jgi:hypothetical protein
MLLHARLTAADRQPLELRSGPRLRAARCEVALGGLKLCGVARADGDAAAELGELAGDQ